jgi:hypothetical protein
LPEGYVNAYYLEDLKRPVSVASVDGRLYAATSDLGVYGACC